MKRFFLWIILCAFTVGLVQVATLTSADDDVCVVPPSGPWPDCATGGDSVPSDPAPAPNPDDEVCEIPAVGPWPPCAINGEWVPTATPPHSQPRPTVPTPTPLVPTATPAVPTPTPSPVPSVSPSPVPSTSSVRQPDGVLGYSANGHPIEWYQFGDGDVDVLLVGGIHGGYEWNTALLAYQMIDHLTQYPIEIPDNVTVHIIPVLNPDGLAYVTGAPGRFSVYDVSPILADTMEGRTNGRNVDLNRNWGCNWQAVAKWPYGTISGGAHPFSEPETLALTQFIYQRQWRLKAAVFWHSKAGLVAPGYCETEYWPSFELSNLYASASGYPSQLFTAYEVNGDVTNWLATIDIPSITIELWTRSYIEWDANLAGTRVLLASLR